jgi:acetyltransferase
VCTPYPAHHEKKFFTKDRSLITVRPIRPEDAGLLVELFNNLSERTIFFRFLRNLKSLPEEWVEHFTCLDYSRDVAMVASEKSESGERLLGVCRIMRPGDTTRGEIAVVVGDAWQGKGIGRILVVRSIEVAKELDITTIWGLVSAENARVLETAARFGFSAKPDPEEGFVELEMNLESDP